MNAQQHASNFFSPAPEADALARDMVDFFRTLLREVARQAQAQQESGGVLLTLTPPPVEQPPFQSAHANEPTSFKDNKPMTQMQSPPFSEFSLSPAAVAVSPTSFIQSAS